MPSISLNNITVASDNAGGNQGLLMPKLQYRYRINFLGFGLVPNDGLELTKQVTDVTRPNVSFDEITLNVYNSRAYLAGKHTWQPVTINVRDDASGGVSRSVGQQLQKQLNFLEQASAGSGQDYKFTTIMEVLDGGNGAIAPVVLERWELYGCFLQSANYNTLNYATSDVVTIAMTLRYDNAYQEILGDGGPGVGGSTPTIAVNPTGTVYSG